MQNILRDKEYFRLERVLYGLEQIKGIGGDFTYDERLPGIRLLCGFLGNLCNAALSPDSFALGWINENWENPRVTRAFPELQGANTLGEAFGLNSTLQGQMIQTLATVFQERVSIRPHSFPLISHFTREHTKALFDPWNSVVDAAFMARRGHSADRQITNVNWPDQRACADGVYVGLARTLTEIQITQLLASSVAGLTVVSCA